MKKQLVAFSLLWSFVLFLAPVPALGNFDSGDCTVGDSPDGNLVTSVVPSCSNDSAVVEVVARSYDNIRSEDSSHSSLRIRIDYICVGNDGQQIRGTPWTKDYSDRVVNVTDLDALFDVKDYSNPQFIATVQQSLQPGTNCTFYLCYEKKRYIPPFSLLGKASPASCVTGDIDECDTANGGCEHSCANTIWSFTCSCDTGYQLDENGLNCSDINECNIAKGGCEHNCTNTIGSFTCSCDTGYQLDEDGLNCSDINECNVKNGSCEHNCTNTIGSFTCSCDTGYQLDENGLNCSDINECNTGNGGCEHNCTNTIGSFFCSCDAGDQLDENGLNCSDTDECNVRNGGCEHSCINTIGSFNCSCDTGYQLEEDGFNCSDINECHFKNGGCEHNCTNTIGSFTCSCDTGYQLDENGLNCSDINECNTGNGGCEHNCTNTIGSFFCTCDTGYQLDENGLNCSDINECNTGNGGCEHNCTNTIGSFFCSCDTGYQLDENGLNCSDIDECNVTNGGCEHSCINTIGSFNCSCDTGYQLEEDGFNCSDINECHFKNGGCEHNCTNTIGSFTCSCDTGYQLDENGLNCSDINECNTGNGGCEHNCTNTIGSFFCSCDAGDQLDENGLNCSDTDECIVTNGGCEHSCINTIGSFNCSCDTGYQLEEDGFNCSDINECHFKNGGCEHNCTNTIGSFTCSCDTGYQLDENGLNCSDINECNTGNGGCEHNCTNTIRSFFCSCDTGYQLDENGLNCSDIDECNVTNGGCEHSCINTIGSFNCSCDTGYQLDDDGLNCSDINECNVKNGSCEHNCTNTIGSFTCSCDTGYQLDENGLNCSVPNSGVALLLAVFVPAVVLIMLISLLCVAICVVCKIRRREPTMFEVHKLLFKDDMLDLTYNPVSPFSIPKHTAFSSMTSVFDKLGTITATETQADDTDTDSKSENIVADPTNEPTDTFLHKNSTSTTSVSPKSNNTLIASDCNHGYYDSNIPQSTDVVSMDKLMQTGSSISPPSYPSEDSEKCINLVLEEDDQNNVNSEADIRNGDDSEAEMCFIGSDYSDTHVGSRTSVVELFSGDHNDAAAHASVVQSKGYVHSENLLADRHGSLDLNSHIIELVSLHSISLEEGADPQSIQTIVESPKNEGYYVQTKELSSTSGYLSATVVSDTHERNCVLPVKPFSEEHIDTAACNSAWESSEYVHSENLRAGSQGSLCTFNLNSYIVESESCHSITLEEAADPQSIPTMEETSKNEGYHVPTKQLQSTSSYISDSTDAANCTPFVEPFSGDHNNTAAYNSAGKSSEYVCSENLLANSHEPFRTIDLNSHIIESESLHSISLVEAVDPQSITTLVESPKNEGYYAQTKKLSSLSGYLSNTVVSDHIGELESEFLPSMCREEAADPHPITSMVEAEGHYTPAEKSWSSPGCLPNTHLLSSIEEKPDSDGLQSPGSSSKYFGMEDDLSMISSSEHYSTTSDSTFGYFNNTFQNSSSPFKAQHLSTSSGYITDYSKAEDELPYNAN